jgi:organic hydroperoxide reductase OsmC/OhrA
VAAVRAKRFDYSASLDEGGRMTEQSADVQLSDAWSAEGLVLAGLVRCSLTSLRYHARRAGISVTRASGSARGAVTKRDTDGRYAFVEIIAELDVELAPEPADLAELLAKAERDCFIGASLTVRPEYRWRVNGGDAVALQP